MAAREIGFVRHNPLRVRSTEQVMARPRRRVRSRGEIEEKLHTFEDRGCGMSAMRPCRLWGI